MSEKRHIDEFKAVIYGCNRCGQCFDVSWLGTGYNRCPAYKHGVFESYGARGKFNIARALVDGVIDYDEDIAERVFACTDCRACVERCPQNLAIPDLLRDVSSEFEGPLWPVKLWLLRRQLDFGRWWVKRGLRRRT